MKKIFFAFLFIALSLYLLVSNAVERPSSLDAEARAVNGRVERSV